MSIELTIEEKIGIAEQHLRNLEFSRYNLELSIKEANASAVPNQGSVDALTLQMNDIDAQQEVINTELNSLNAAKTTSAYSK